MSTGKVVPAVIVTVLVLVLLFTVGEYGYRWLTACRGEERAVFDEFPQYSPRVPQELDPRPDWNAFTAIGDGCFVAYRTPDVASEVTEYFEERWKENGWQQAPSTGHPLTVRKGNYEYRLSFAGDPTSHARGTPVNVLVKER